jgi:hypothetical protein
MYNSTYVIYLNINLLCIYMYYRKGNLSRYHISQVQNFFISA